MFQCLVAALRIPIDTLVPLCARVCDDKARDENRSGGRRHERVKSIEGRGEGEVSSIVNTNSHSHHGDAQARQRHARRRQIKGAEEYEG